jgi:hypothetical protein
MMKAWLVFACWLTACHGFLVGSSTSTLVTPRGASTISTTQCYAARKPTFNKSTQKWERAADDDGSYPYDAVGALLRHGPAPFLSRLTDPAGYEQTVLSYMASTGASRAEATGNMDAKLNNAADWAYQKMEEKRGAGKVDYTKLDKKEAALVIIWALGITPLTLNVIIKTFSQYEGPHQHV